MRTVSPQPIELLPHAGRRKRRESGADATHRRAVPEDAVLWFAPDGRSARHAASAAQSQARSTPDASDGPGGRVPQATHHAARRKPQDLPVFTARSADRASQPGVERRHHVHPDAQRLHVPGGGNRLVQSPCVELAIVEHAGGQLLRGGDRSGAGTGRAPGDFQQRSGSSIHESCADQPMGNVGRGDLDGRPWQSTRQRVYRAALVEREVRVDLSARLRHGAITRSRIADVLRLLQLGF